jgi:CheY-like chemotaxis protein
MGGRIGIVSEAGRGSSFWFVLPLTIAETPATQPVRTEGAWRAARVLVFEPNAAAGQILCRYLRSWGADADSVTSLGQAQERMQQAAQTGTPFTVLLLDDTGPEYVTLAAVQPLRQVSAGGHLPIILMAPQGHDKATPEVRAQGADIILQKPIRQSELHDAIQGNLLCFMPEHKRAVGAVATPAPAVQADGRSKRILVADDNQVNLLLASAMLKALGYAAQTVSNGQEVLNALDSQHFDLVLMDCQMPEMDGYEATRAIRSREAERGGHIPIVALTANALQEDAQKCMAAGMDGYLTKPIKKARLGDMLSTWLNPND